MSEILAQNLSGKQVVQTDGKALGMLHNVTMDVTTGELQNIRITPDEEVHPNTVSYNQDKNGYILIPIRKIKAVKDCIVV